MTLTHGIRAAKTSDLPRLMPLVIENYREEKPFPVSEEKVAQILARCVEQNRAIAGVIEGPAGIESSVAATIDQEDYSDQLIVRVHWLFVVPVLRRRGDHNSRMLGYLKWFNQIISAEAGCPVPVMMQTFLSDSTRGKVQFLDKRAPLVGVVHGYGVSETVPLQHPAGCDKVGMASQGAPVVRAREPA